MNYYYSYITPSNFSNIIMTSDGTYLTGLRFIDDDSLIDINMKFDILPIFQETSKWLDIYFSGKNPHFTPKYKIQTNTNFRKEAIEIIEKIPFGQVLTYSDIANELAKRRNIKKMSSQAVGGAAHVNPICIIIPCHRVVGKNGKLVGYGGGINNKAELLKNENWIVKDLIVSKED